MTFLFKGSASLSSGTNLVKNSTVKVPENNPNDAESLSSGINLVKTSTIKVPETKSNDKVYTREEKLERLKGFTTKIFIITSCGEFSIGNACFDRLSDLIIDTYFNANLNKKRIDIDAKSLDHETFLFIHRYIRSNIKVNLNVLCNRLGVTTQEGLLLLKQWGYDESICVTNDSLL
jgi:hypothetical protein